MYLIKVHVKDILNDSPINPASFGNTIQFGMAMLW